MCLIFFFFKHVCQNILWFSRRKISLIVFGRTSRITSNSDTVDHALVHWIEDGASLSPNERTCSTGVSLWCGTTSRCRCWRSMTRKPFLIIHTSAGMRTEASCAASAIICLCFGCAHTRECADRNLEVGWARSLEKREIRCQTRCGNFLGHPDGNNISRPSAPPSVAVVVLGVMAPFGLVRRLDGEGNSSWRCSSWIDGQLSFHVCVAVSAGRQSGPQIVDDDHFGRSRRNQFSSRRCKCAHNDEDVTSDRSRERTPPFTDRPWEGIRVAVLVLRPRKEVNWPRADLHSDLKQRRRGIQHFV